MSSAAASYDDPTRSPTWGGVGPETGGRLLDMTGVRGTEREWMTFVSIVRAVARENASVINPNAVRPLLRAADVHPRRVSAFYFLAQLDGVITIRTGRGRWVQSDDTEARNHGKPVRVYDYTEAPTTARRHTPGVDARADWTLGHVWRDTVYAAWQAATHAWEAHREAEAIGYATEMAEFEADHPRPRLRDFMEQLTRGGTVLTPVEPLDLLETHGCQGGAHGGYTRAGWRVTGVDNKAAHARYYPGEPIIGDAATVIREQGHRFAARHTSPPCQWYTRGNAPRRGTATKWERTIPPIREALEEVGGPYVIENVKDAVWDLRDPILLCGCMFNLSALDYSCTAASPYDRIAHLAAGACNRFRGVRVHLERPRLFEVNWEIPDLVEQQITVRGEAWTVRSPRACDHTDHRWVAGAYGGARRDKFEAKFIRKGGYVPPDKALVQRLLGFTAADRAGRPDQTWEGLFECLPPAYTEWMGARLRDAVSGGVVA